MGVTPGFAGGMSKDTLHCMWEGDGLGETAPLLEITFWLDSPSLLYLGHLLMAFDRSVSKPETLELGIHLISHLRNSKAYQMGPHGLLGQGF